MKIRKEIQGISFGIKNEKREFFSWKDIVKNEKFQKNQKNLVLPIGRTIGEDIFLDFYKDAHLAISGATGSGKSNFLLSLIASLMTKFNSKELKLILADPKRVEFSIFKDSPYLMKPIIQTTEQALSAVKELVIEMDKRYELLEDTNVRNIFEYNKKKAKKLSFIFFIVDEISDFMLDKKNNANRKIEKNIIKLLQKSHDIGINIIISTSRPCKKALPIMLLTNLLNRLALKMGTETDSKFFLYYSGAEKLLGKGDAIFYGTDNHKLRRIQTPLITDKEIQSFIEAKRKFNSKPNI